MTPQGADDKVTTADAAVLMSYSCGNHLLLYNSVHKYNIARNLEVKYIELYCKL